MLSRSLRRLISTQEIKQRTITNSQYHRMASTLPKLPVFEAISQHDPQRTAVIHSRSGRRFTYGELLKDVADASSKLRQSAGRTDLDGRRIAFLVENGYDYVGMSPGCKLKVVGPLLLMAASHVTLYPRNQ